MKAKRFSAKQKAWILEKKKGKRKKENNSGDQFPSLKRGPALIKKTKEELYQERLKNSKHYEKMYVDQRFFSGRDIDRLQEVRDTCRAFNSIVERETNSKKYSVTLRYGIPKIAADFHFQFRGFQSYARDFGLFPEIKEELTVCGATLLFKNCLVKQESGRFSLSMDFFSETKKINSTQFRLLVLYKSRSSAPNRNSKDLEMHPGITGLADTTAAGILSCSSSTIRRARKELQRLGLVEQIYYNGRHRKMAIHV